MGLEIFWSQFAKLKLEEIYQYYRIKANKRTAQKIANGIVNQTIDLDKNPQIGQGEEGLKDKIREFRYLVYTDYKIIYYINKKAKRIIIANIFDTRQNPEKIKETL